MKYIVLFLFTTTTAILVAYFYFQTYNELTYTPPSYTPNPLITQISEMSLPDKVGQLFMVGYWPNSDTSKTLENITEHKVGGIIIMEAGGTEQLKENISAWQAISPTPLLIAIDQEGGVVQRLKGTGFVNTSQRDITTIDQARGVGKERGEELKDLGINTNFAPVLEISQNPKSFLYPRVFAEPEMISDLAAAMIEGHGEAGVIAVPKHFPGHEDTPVDSHLELPVLTVSKEDFTEHTKTFRQVTQNSNPQMMMTAHVLVPSLDPTYPATLSPTILSYLRNDIGYEDIIITDDMTMKAVSDRWSTDKATVQAIKAGADLILFAAEPEKAKLAIEAVLQAVKAGVITEARLNQSVYRILKLKQQHFTEID